MDRFEEEITQELAEPSTCESESVIELGKQLIQLSKPDLVSTLPKKSQISSQSYQQHISPKYDRKLVYYIIYNTQTTGLPANNNMPMQMVQNWPRLLQIAYIALDENFEPLHQGISRIVNQNLNSTQEALEIHGITQEIQLQYGDQVQEVLKDFLQDSEYAKVLIAYNVDFHYNVVGAELCRLIQQEPAYSDALNRWTHFQHSCVMNNIDLLQAYSHYNNYFNGYRFLKLRELYKRITNKEMPEERNAMRKVLATCEIVKLIAQYIVPEEYQRQQ